MTPGEPRSPSSRTVAIWVVACCVLTLLAKLHVNLPRTQPGHGDVSFYYSVAKNLAQGRGFVVDCIWSFWSQPAGIPAYGNDWWMPLTSALAALGLLVGGESYVSAQNTMIGLTSVLPLLVYLLGAELWRSRAVGLVGALLATTVHPFLDKACAPLSHAPYVVLVPLALWLIARAARTGRGWGWAGVAIGLTQLARSDGIVLFGALLAAALSTRPRPTLRALLAAPLGWALALSPWWIHNLVVLGTPLPGSALRAVFLNRYDGLYSLPESISPATWLAQGWGPVLELKRHMAAITLSTAATGLVTEASPRGGGWTNLPLVALQLLAWLGLVTTLRRRFIPFWTQWALEWIFYTLVFTAVGAASFGVAMYGLYPMLVLCAAAGLLLLGRGLAGLARLLRAGATRRQQLAAAFVGGASIWLVAGQLRYAEDAMVAKGASIDEIAAAYAGLRRQVIEPLGLQDAVFMASGVHELGTLAGLKGVMIPVEPEPVVRQVAQRYGATHLLLVNEAVRGDAQGRSLRPALLDIDANPHYRCVARPASDANAGYRFRLYQILD